MFFSKKKLDESHQKYKEKIQNEEAAAEQKRSEIVKNFIDKQFEEYTGEKAQQCYKQLEQHYEFYGTFKGFKCEGHIAIDIKNEELKQLKKKFPQHDIKLTEVCYSGCRAGCISYGPAIKYTIPANHFQFKD